MHVAVKTKVGIDNSRLNAREREVRCQPEGGVSSLQGIRIPMAQGRSTKIISMIKWIQTSRLSKENSLPRRYDGHGGSATPLAYRGTSLIARYPCTTGSMVISFRVVRYIPWNSGAWMGKELEGDRPKVDVCVP